MSKKDRQEAAAEAKMIMPPFWPDDNVRRMGLKLIRMGLELLDQPMPYTKEPPPPPRPQPLGEPPDA
jgi:hypothetical protein